MLRSAPALDGVFAAYPWLATLLGVVLLVLVAWIAVRVGRRLLVRLLTSLTRASDARWDDAIVARGAVRRIADGLPALVLYLGVQLVPGLPPFVDALVRNVALAFLIVTLARAISAVLAALNDVYVASGRGVDRPIKGYLQVVNIVVFVVAAILAIAVLADRSPLLLLSGLGAMTAVLMLVFKDTLLSLVASVQLTSNDMLRVGDWIEMPQLGADGDVVDIALHTVKVQNWDKTITTIPTHRLISESYRNWRGMSESGGRRIKRSLFIDQTSVRYLTPEERERMQRVALLAPYLAAKQAELEEYNAALAESGQEPVNTRRLTNLGTFRAYVQAYLLHHPRIHSGMTLLVRQLQPGPTGLPLEVYCFTRTVRWAEYEGIQSDLFDHLLAVLPELGLRVFQAPTGADVTAGIAALTGQQPESAAAAPANV